MKTTKLFIMICTISLNTVYAQENSANDASHPNVEHRYFGQNPLGLIPELFAPDFEGSGFSPDMTKLSFTKSSGKYKRPTLFSSSTAAFF